MSLGIVLCLFWTLEDLLPSAALDIKLRKPKTQAHFGIYFLNLVLNFLWMCFGREHQRAASFWGGTRGQLC